MCEMKQYGVAVIDAMGVCTQGPIAVIADNALNAVEGAIFYFGLNPKETGIIAVRLPNIDTAISFYTGTVSDSASVPSNPTEYD